MMIENLKPGFGKLPDEAVINILSHVPVSDLYKCASVCRRWRLLIETETNRTGIVARAYFLLINSVSSYGFEILPPLRQIKKQLASKDFQEDVFAKADRLLGIYFSQINIFHLQQVKCCSQDSFVEKQTLHLVHKIAAECFARRFSWRRVTVSLGGIILHPISHNFLTTKVRWGPLVLGFPRFDLISDLTTELDLSHRVVYESLPDSTPISVDLESVKNPNLNPETVDYFLKFFKKRSLFIHNLSLGHYLPIQNPWGDDFDTCVESLMEMENLGWLSLNLKPSIEDKNCPALCRFLRGNRKRLLLHLHDCRLTFKGVLALVRVVADARRHLSTTLTITSTLLTNRDITFLKGHATLLKQKKHDFLFKNRISSSFP